MEEAIEQRHHFVLKYIKYLNFVSELYLEFILS